MKFKHGRPHIPLKYKIRGWIATLISLGSIAVAVMFYEFDKGLKERQAAEFERQTLWLCWDVDTRTRHEARLQAIETELGIENNLVPRMKPLSEFDVDCSKYYKDVSGG